MIGRRSWIRVGGLGLALVAVGAVAAWGVDHGWWWLVHPDRATYPVRGIDVSHHQGAIAWDRVAADDVGFAWLKASEGGDYQDPRFEEYRREADRVGLPWGAYHFFTFCADPEVQAANLIAATAGDWGRLPPAIDVETGGNCNGTRSAVPLREGIQRFTDRIEAAGAREPVLYVIDTQIGALFGAEPPPLRLWYRSLIARPPAEPPAITWQYHSRAAVDGIDGYVDLDVFVGSRADFARWTGGQ